SQPEGFASGRGGPAASTGHPKPPLPAQDATPPAGNGPPFRVGQLIPESAVGYPTAPPQDPNFQTTSPLVGGPHVAPIATPKTAAKAKGEAPKSAEAPATIYLKNPDGTLVLIDGQPVPVVDTKKATPKDSKPKKAVDLDPARLQNLLNKPR